MYALELEEAIAKLEAEICKNEADKEAFKVTLRKQMSKFVTVLLPNLSSRSYAMLRDILPQFCTKFVTDAMAKNYKVYWIFKGTAYKKMLFLLQTRLHMYLENLILFGSDEEYEAIASYYGTDSDYEVMNYIRETNRLIRRKDSQMAIRRSSLETLLKIKQLNARNKCISDKTNDQIENFVQLINSSTVDDIATMQINAMLMMAIGNSSVLDANCSSAEQLDTVESAVIECSNADLGNFS